MCEVFYMLNEAKSFIQTMYKELNYNEKIILKRLNQIETQINLTGTYEHTNEELEYGAKMAWRNSNRCIGRAFWDALTVKDARHIQSEDEFIDAIENHIQFATNDGKIKPCITIFDAQHPPKYIIINLSDMQVMKT